MIITYEVDNGLYVNVTNKCTNKCSFCVRTIADGHYGELWLEKEPTKEEILDSILSRNLDKYSEIVFCGYGEPTIRLYDILYVSSKVKAKSNIKIRINTNGHANMIFKKDVTPLLKGVIDSLSISLNTADANSYLNLCKPCFGTEAYEGLLDFANKASNYVDEVMLSVVKTTIPDEDIEKCKEIALKNNVKLKIRELITE